MVFRHAGRLRKEALTRGVWETVLAEAEKAALPLLKEEAGKRFPLAFLAEPEARAEELDLRRDGDGARWEGEFVAAARVLVPDYGRPVGMS